MADVKISELTALTSPDGAEELVVNDGGTTKKITITNATSASLAKTGGTMTGALFIASPNQATGGSALQIRQGNNTPYGIDMGISQTTGDLNISKVNNGTSTHMMTLGRYSGNVGVGVAAPTKKLDVYGEAQISWGGVDSYLYYQSASNYTGRKTDGNMWMNAAGSQANVFGINGTEEVRIDSDGLKFNGDTAAANALQDYETGTWTPVTSLGTATANAGTYTKIGRQVYVGGDITFPAQSNSGAAIISGLPFSSANADGAATAGYTNFLAEQLLLTANAGATISLYGLTTSAVGGLSWTQMSGKRVVFSYVYHV